MIVYNEIDPFAAAWLRELIKANMIAPGEVWENDIRDIRPIDLRGVVQFHGFAGIGVWSYAARRAGWPDDRPLWTMSCPCQPFSAAGQGAGFADERHLWPHAHWLISQCRPAVVAGEQVASKDADAWIDLVQDDMEALGYAFGTVPFPSASVGAPHIRDRDYWMAYANGRQRDGLAELRGFERDGTDAGRPQSGRELGACGDNDGLEHPESDGRLEWRPEPGGWSAAGGRGAGGLANTFSGGQSGASGSGGTQEQRTAECGVPGRVADAESSGREYEPFKERSSLQSEAHGQAKPFNGLAARSTGVDAARRNGPTNGFWRDADWLFCRDGKWRPVEPGTFPLAHGAPARVGRLRGYGNAINAVQAQIFLETVKEIVDGWRNPLAREKQEYYNRTVSYSNPPERHQNDKLAD